MDDAAAQEIREKVTQANHDKTSLNQWETLQLVRNAMEDSALHHGHPLSGVPSKKTLKKKADEIGLTFREGQTTTPARWKEGRDLRNMATMAALNAVWGNVPADLLGNLDATTFQVDWKEASHLTKLKGGGTTS